MNQREHSNPDNLQVLFEDNHLIAVVKRPGDIIQGDKTGDRPLSEIVKEYLKTKYKKPGKVFLGVVHRLDRPTSGVVVFARTSKALSRMNALFANGQTRKTYWAVVGTAPPNPTATLEHWMERNTRQNKSYAHSRMAPKRKRAILRYQILHQLNRYTLLEIELETGRHHQIRAQLAALGCSIKGDLKYGAPRSNADGSIHLHARRLEFVHPVRKEPLDLIAPLPDDPIWNDCPG